MKYLDVPSSGSIADRTHSHNRAGQYTRNRRSPVQPIGSGRRALVRAAFGNASTGWAGLTFAQQDAWRGFADAHPVTDSLGQSIKLTGHQMYVGMFVNATNVEETPLTDPPTDLTVPDVSAATLAFSIATGIQFDGYTGTADQFVSFSISRPLSPGIRFWKTFWQPFGVNNHGTGDSAPDGFITAIYTAQFGTVTAGQQVFGMITPYSADFWRGTPKICRAIITA